MTTTPTPLQVLRFWFGDGPWLNNTNDGPVADPPFRDVWFKQNDAFDADLTNRFSGTYELAAAGQLDHWADAPLGAVALTIILDQFPRNLFRGSARAFATDDKALTVAMDAIDWGFDLKLPKALRMFLYMPFEHSENAKVQTRSLELFASLDDDFLLQFAKDHHDVITRFRRFPHRNVLLGRQSTPDEIHYLETEGAATAWVNGTGEDLSQRN